MAIHYADGSNSASGRVVQVIHSTSDSYNSITSTSYTDFTNYYIDITPKENGNKIVISMTIYMNNRDNDPDSRVAMRVLEGYSSSSSTVYFPNANEGENAHQWINKATSNGSTDTDMWQPITLHFTVALPSSGRAGVSHRYKLQGNTNPGSDYIRGLGFSCTAMEITV